MTHAGGRNLDQTISRLCVNRVMLSLVWLIITLIGCNPEIRKAGFFSGMVNDPDSYLHLVRHWQGNWWQTGGWTDRINAPYGTVIHWTIPYDLFLWLIRAPLSLIVSDSRQALAVAGAWSSAIPALISMHILYGFGRSYRDRATGFVMAVLYMTAPPIMWYSCLGRADHHSLTLMCSVAFLVLLHGQAMRPDWKRALLTGIVGALGIWTAPEIIPPMVAGLGLWCCWHVLEQRPLQPAHLLIGAGMVMVLGIGLLLDPPYGGVLRPDTDRLSLVFLFFGGLLNLFMMIALYANRWRMQPWYRMAAIVVAGGLVGGIWLGLFPHALTGPIGMVSTDLRIRWLPFISEMRPIDKISAAIWFLSLGCMGLVVVVVRAVHLRAQPSVALFWASAGCVLLLGIFGGAMATRLSYFTALAAIMPLSLLWGWLARSGIVVRVYAVLIVAVCQNVLGGWAELLEQKYAATSEASQSSQKAITCKSADFVRDKLNTLPPTIVMANQNAGSALLWWTHHDVIAAPYHRNEQGILDSIDFFGAKSVYTLSQITDRRQANVVVLCRDPNRIRSGNDLWNNILSGAVIWPGWSVWARIDRPDMARSYTILIRDAWAQKMTGAIPPASPPS